MAKNNKGKVIQMLSPDNYIRKKARTLPIFECLVTSNWDEKKMATVIIARNHVNGNITVCTYLVDLMCLGVKDSMFLFNVSVPQYEEFKQKINGEMDMDEVDYTLAHNIVLAGIEFAEEYGFKPHKDYESVTKFMLEEDTEDIELIEIECGVDGQPVYMRGPFDDDAKARKIVAQLERTAGPGNYGFVDSPDDWGDEDDFDFDNEDEFDEFDQMSSEEKKELFLDFSSRIDDLDDEERERFGNLLSSFMDDLVDVDRYDQFYDTIFEDIVIEVDEDEIPDQLLGIRPGDQMISEEVKNRFMDVYNLIGEDPKQASKELNLFQREQKELPGAYFLELLLLQTEESPKYAKQLKEYALKYPDYALIQLMWIIEQITTEKNAQKFLDYQFKLESFFHDREIIHPIERIYALMLYAFLVAKQNDISKIEAFASVLDDLDLSEIEEEVLGTTVWMFKISYLLNNFNDVMDL